MANIESIKQKILQLDAGSFQNLCDAYLSKIGCYDIVSLGSHAGTRKTTQGTPDTYFCTPDGRYVFVEYTTQLDNLFKKIMDDISKCLDINETQIPHNQIAEIIYCHTSSNIKPAKDNQLKSLCRSVGIKLTIIGIDKLAEELYLYHHMLVRDFLGIAISTGQIQTQDDFIKTYNAHKMAAPIDTEFLFRDEEIKNIELAFENSDVVVLSGVAGTGKTRLALECGKLYSNKHNSRLYCIRSNSLPIYDDLKIFIDTPGDYFILVDDANHLSGLQHIIRYITLKQEGYHVKILITVRDYAIKKVTNDISEFSDFKHIIIKAFSDDEIKELLDTALGIKNSDYLNRIVKIAEGNARLAILSGKVACSSNRITSIQDASQLYDDYYGRFLEQEQILDSNEMLISAGIVAFLEAIHLDYIDVFQLILSEKGLSRDIFIEAINKLHHMEVLDICNDKAVRFSEQCLSNYLIKYVFFDKKLLSLSEMIYLCFPKHKERTISSINTLFNIFANKTLYDFVAEEIKIVWERLLKEDSPYFLEFVEVFFKLNPTKALLIIQERINNVETVLADISEIDTESGKNNQNITSDIISILGGFADMNDLPSALDLFFEYYNKRPDLYMEFYHAANRYFSITKNSFNNDFYTQINFLNKMKENSEDSTNEYIILLFIKIAKEFLKLHFTPIEGGRKHSFTVYQIPLLETDGSKEYRKIIWEWLFELCKTPKYKVKVYQVLYAYHGCVEEVSAPITQYDMTYIQSIMETYFSPTELKNCLLAKHLSKNIACDSVLNQSLFANYFEGSQFQLYSILKGPSYSEGMGYVENEKIKRKNIEEYVLACNLSMVKGIIDLCADINVIDGHSKWKISEGLSMAFEILYSEHNYYVDAIKYYIECDTPCDLNACRLIQPLFSLISENEVFELITAHQYSHKNAWLYAYYHQLPDDKIRQKHVEGLYDFLSQSTDEDIKSSSMRDLDFLDKYRIIDENIFIKVCEIILNKREYSMFIVDIYFGLFFNKCHNTPQELISKFKLNPELLCEIYSVQLLYHNHDYDGEFLREIYLACPSVLDTYIDVLVNESKRIKGHNSLSKCFFELTNFIEIYNKIFEQIVNLFEFPESSVPFFLENVLLPVENAQALLEKQDAWIRQCIEVFSNDEIKMKCLFAVISKLNTDRKIEYIRLFCKFNSSFANFEKISILPTSYSWSGSAIPMYSDWIEFLQQLLPNFIGLKWIQHKNYVEERISSLKERIKAVEIDEMLRD